LSPCEKESDVVIAVSTFLMPRAAFKQASETLGSGSRKNGEKPGPKQCQKARCISAAQDPLTSHGHAQRLIQVTLESGILTRNTRHHCPKVLVRRIPSLFAAARITNAISSLHCRVMICSMRGIEAIRERLCSPTATSHRLCANKLGLLSCHREQTSADFSKDLILWKNTITNY
ncbi:hypothetical protein STEG23_009753, partial [Scotinomys teguina]